MFFENDIEILGNRLIKKASLEKNTTFSVIPSWEIDDANVFDSTRRIVYCIPERNFYEFKNFPSVIFEKFGSNSDTFLEVQKIIISHEIGHALQSNLNELFSEVDNYKSLDTLAKIGSIESLFEHIEKYRTKLVVIEKDAWELAWLLIKDEVNEELFNLIRERSLRTYEEGDMLNGESEFLETYIFLNEINSMDLIGFNDKNGEETVRIKIIQEGTTFLAELLREDKEYFWLPETVRHYNKSSKKWMLIDSSFNLNSLQFAIDFLKENLSEV